MQCRDNSEASLRIVGGAMTLRVCGTFISFLLLSVQLAAGQAREVAGRVTNATTEEGIAGATIAVSGTGIVAETNTDGNYVLGVPDGDQTLVVRAIGFKHQRVTIPGSQASANVALEPDVFKLEAKIG